MKKPLGSIGLIVIVALVGCSMPWSYGPSRDTSGFVTAMLSDSNQVVFSFKYVVYQPAQGLAAFPDGWTAKFLAERGLDLQETHLVSDSGHIVLVTSSKSSKVGPEGGQIWLRSPDDRYHEVVKTHHYQGVENGEIIYWLPDTRRFKAYNMTTFSTRDLSDYKVRPFVDVTRGVFVPSNGEKIEYGRKTKGKWSYVPLPLSPEDVKNAKVTN